MNNLIVSQHRQIKAIETSYAGYKFRSRLEARYAVFFNALGIEWDYEPEGYELANGEWYLPDFFIRRKPGSVDGYWIEIKGANPSAEEIEKTRLLCYGSDHHGVMFVGLPGSRYPISFNNRHSKKHDACLCDSYSDSFEAVFHSPVFFCADFDRSIFAEAVSEARSARFEHGAQG